MFPRGVIQNLKNVLTLPMNYAKRVNAVKVGFLLFVNSKSKKEERTISGETDYQNVLTITQLKINRNLPDDIKHMLHQLCHITLGILSVLFRNQ